MANDASHVIIARGEAIDDVDDEVFIENLSLRIDIFKEIG